MPLRSARAAYTEVLADVGANARLDCLGRWIKNPDTVDLRLLAQTRDNSGPKRLLAQPADAGGYPVIAPAVACADHDRDGMADDWERQHRFDPSNPTDGPADADRDGYSNLEEYLNGSPPRAG